MMKKDTEKKIKEYRQDVEATYGTSLANSIEDTDFVLNYQLKQDDIDEAESKGIPLVQFNEVAPFVNLVAGIQAQNRQDIKVVGTSDEDDFFADVLTDCVKHVIRRNNGEYIMSRTFKDGLIGARGYTVIDMDYSEDIIDGNIRMRNEPFTKMFVDPDARQYDFAKDAEFMLQRVRINRRKLDKVFSKYKSKIKDLSPDSSSFDSVLNNYSVVEFDPSTGYDKPVIYGADSSPANRPASRLLYTVDKVWYKEYETRKFVLYQDSGDFIDITENKLSKEEEQNISTSREDAVFLTRELEIPRVAYMIGNDLIEDDVSPDFPYCKTFPIVQYCPSHNPIGQTIDKIYQSFVRPLKEPQMYINKGMSQDLHIKNSIANGIWIVDKGVLGPKGKRYLKKFGSVPGLVVTKEGEGEIRREFPGNNTTAHSNDEKNNSDIMKRIRGMSNTLSMQEKTESGAALEIRRQQGLTAIFDVLDNNKYSTRITGQRLVEFILGTFTAEKMVKVVGERKQLGNGDMTGKISYEEAEALLAKKDIFKYDIAFDEQSYSPTMRLALNQQLEKWAQNNLMPLPVIQETMLENSSISGKEKLKASLKEYNKSLVQSQTQGGQQ